ncbi:putative caspase [Metarhizium anisopliae]
MFNLAVNDSQEYEILDETLQRIRSLPTVPIDTPDAEHHVLATLQHLAEFKYAEGIENRLPNSSLEASFSLLSSADAKAPDTWAVDDIEHGGIWRLALENHSESPLYMAIFNLTASWKISNLLSSAGDNAFRVMQPRGEEELRMEMKVPDWLQRLGGRHCEDVIKVFVTSKPTSFPSLILPEIALHAQHRGGVRGSGDALSIALALLKLDKMAINPPVAKMTMINRAVRLPTRWQTTTGATRRMAMNGATRIRTARHIDNGEKICKFGCREGRRLSGV